MQPGAYKGVGSKCRRGARFACHSFFFLPFWCAVELPVTFPRLLLSSLVSFFACPPIFFVIVDIRALPSHLFGGCCGAHPPFRNSSPGPQRKGKPRSLSFQGLLLMLIFS